MEIYKEKVRCLLDPHAGTDLEVRPDPAGGMCAVGAAQVQVASEDELMEVVLKGSRARCVVRARDDVPGHVPRHEPEVGSHVDPRGVLSPARTNRSPSHCTKVATSGTHSPAPQSSTGLNSRSSRSHAVLIITVDRYAVSSAAHVGRHGKLLLVDLSGSETLSKSGAEGTQLEEAKMINKSLSTLGLVIMALSERKASHVPYRCASAPRHNE